MTTDRERQKTMLALRAENAELRASLNARRADDAVKALTADVALKAEEIGRLTSLLTKSQDSEAQARTARDLAIPECDRLRVALAESLTEIKKLREALAEADATVMRARAAIESLSKKKE